MIFKINSFSQVECWSESCSESCSFVRCWSESEFRSRFLYSPDIRSWSRCWSRSWSCSTCWSEDI